jgi:hypothetical protein
MRTSTLRGQQSPKILNSKTDRGEHRKLQNKNVIVDTCDVLILSNSDPKPRKTGMEGKKLTSLLKICC